MSAERPPLGAVIVFHFFRLTVTRFSSAPRKPSLVIVLERAVRYSENFKVKAYVYRMYSTASNVRPFSRLALHFFMFSGRPRVALLGGSVGGVVSFFCWANHRARRARVRSSRVLLTLSTGHTGFADECARCCGRLCVLAMDGTPARTNHHRSTPTHALGSTQRAAQENHDARPIPRNDPCRYI